MRKISIISDHIIYVCGKSSYTSATVLFPKGDLSKVTLFGRLVFCENEGEFINLNKLPDNINIKGYKLCKKGGLGYILSIKDIIFNLISIMVKSEVLVLKMPYFSSLIAMFFCFLVGKKYILYFIGFGENNLEAKGKFLLAKTLKKILKICVFLSKNIVFVSEELKKSYMGESGFSKKNILILPELDSDKYVKIASNLSLSKIKKDILKIGYIGRFSEEKGVSDLPDIIGGMDGVNLTIIGDGPLKSEIIHELLLKGVITLDCGWIKHGADLFEEINKLDILIIPSKTEGFGLVAIEANICGVPVIAKSVGGLKNVVVDGVNGYLVDNNDNFRDKILFFKNNLGILDDMKVTSKKYAMSFLKVNCYQENLDLYLNEIFNIK